MRAHGGNIPSRLKTGDQGRVKVMMKVFKAATTEDEKAFLLSKTEAKAKQLKSFRCTITAETGFSTPEAAVGTHSLPTIA